MSSGDERVDEVDRMLADLMPKREVRYPVVVNTVARGMPSGGVHLEVIEHSGPGVPHVTKIKLETQADVARHIRTILEVSLRGLELNERDAGCLHRWTPWRGHNTDATHRCDMCGRVR